MANQIYCSFEQSRRLKEKGFDREVNHFYLEDGTLEENRTIGRTAYANFNDGIHVSAPTSVEALRFLEDKFGIVAEVFIDDGSEIPWSHEIFSKERDENGDWTLLVPQWKISRWTERMEESCLEAVTTILDYLDGKNFDEID